MNLFWLTEPDSKTCAFLGLMSASDAMQRPTRVTQVIAAQILYAQEGTPEETGLSDSPWRLSRCSSCKLVVAMPAPAQGPHPVAFPTRPCTHPSFVLGLAFDIYTSFCQGLQNVGMHKEPT